MVHPDEKNAQKRNRHLVYSMIFTFSAWMLALCYFFCTVILPEESLNKLNLVKQIIIWLYVANTIYIFANHYEKVMKNKKLDLHTKLSWLQALTYFNAFAAFHYVNSYETEDDIRIDKSESSK